MDFPNGHTGIPLLPPDVNRSEIDFGKEEDAIRVGFYPIFELSDKTKQRLIAVRKERPFRDLYDFLRRTRAGQKEIEYPLTLYKDVIPWESMVRSIDLEKCKNRKVQFTSWYVTSRLQETVSGKYMKFLSLEDLFGVSEVIFFLEVYEKYAESRSFYRNRKGAVTYQRRRRT